MEKQMHGGHRKIHKAVKIIQLLPCVLCQGLLHLLTLNKLPLSTSEPR